MSPAYKYDTNFGKYLLAIFDVIMYFFLFKIYADRKEENSVNRGLLVSALVFTNPFLIYLSVRGSCEGITMTLATSFLYFYFGG